MTVRRVILRLILPALLSAVLATAIEAQNTAAQPPEPPQRTPRYSAADLAAKVPAPKPEDVKSADAILHAIYEVISGPAGDRDWARCRSLFLSQSRLTHVGKAADGSAVVVTWSLEEFIHDATEIFAKEGFYENEITNHSSSFGNMMQVFSSYESRHSPSEKPFQRGINSIQLLDDGKRWWVVSILWDSERPDNPLPAELARKR